MFLAISLLASCSMKDQSREEGQVQFKCSLSQSADLVKSTQKTLPGHLVPSADQFKLVISSEVGEVAAYPTFAEYDTPLLKQGNYNALFTYGDPSVEAAENAAFAGTVDFTILPRRIVNASVTLALVNSVASLEVGEWFKKYYTSYEFTITTASNAEFTFSGNEAEPIVSTDPFFVKAATDLYISGSAVKTNGSEVQFSETKVGTTVARTWHTLVVDANEASGSSVNVTFNDQLVPVEVVEIELNPEI